MRVTRLRGICGDYIYKMNKESSGLGGGSFESTIKTCKRKRFFIPDNSQGKKRSYIILNKPLIRKELERYNKVVRVNPKWPRSANTISQPIIEPSIKILDKVTAVVTRAKKN
jgi:hypothetical protein